MADKVVTSPPFAVQVMDVLRPRVERGVESRITASARRLCQVDVHKVNQIRPLPERGILPGHLTSKLRAKGWELRRRACRLTIDLWRAAYQRRKPAPSLELRAWD